MIYFPSNLKVNFTPNYAGNYHYNANNYNTGKYDNHGAYNEAAEVRFLVNP